MFINNCKSNWEMYAKSVHKFERKSQQNGTDGIVKRVDKTTNDLLREVERVVTTSPSEGNFTPLIIGNIMAYDLTSFVIDTTLAIIKSRNLTSTDVADIAANVAHDYTISLANLAYQKVAAKLIEMQLNDVAV